MKIYLAGKIGKNDWRHHIVRDLRYTCASMEENPLPVWPLLLNSILDHHDYTGPYFISCDHGCYHGKSQHGVGLRSGGCSFGHLPSQDIVVKRCQEAISNSDLVFAWLDSADAYGTLVEIGYAVALNKTVVIAKPEYIPDMWFVHAMAYKSIDAKTPLEGLREAVRQVFKGMSYRDYLQTAHWELTRAAALERAAHRCQLCNGLKGGLNVHHRTYERLGAELPEDLIVLCRDCHHIFHKEGKLAR